MASVGDVLQEAEEGWNRYDDKDSKISYSDGMGSSGYFYTTRHLCYDTTITSSLYANYGTETCSFTFFGTQFRVISCVWSSACKEIGVFVDSTEIDTFNQNTYGNRYQVLVYESPVLSEATHEIVLEGRSLGSANYYTIDAIDLIEPAVPTGAIGKAFIV